MKAILENQNEDQQDQNKETVVDVEFKEVEEDVQAEEEVEVDAGDGIQCDEVMHAAEVDEEAMEVNEEVSEKTAWADELLKRSEASEMGAFRQKQVVVQGNEATCIQVDGELQGDMGEETTERTCTGESLQGSEELEVGEVIQAGEDMQIPDLEPVEVRIV